MLVEIGRGVFKRLGDCTGSAIARRFFANATDAELDLIASWQMVKLVEEAHLRYTSEHQP